MVFNLVAISVPRGKPVYLHQGVYCIQLYIEALLAILPDPNQYVVLAKPIFKP